MGHRVLSAAAVLQVRACLVDVCAVVVIVVAHCLEPQGADGTVMPLRESPPLALERSPARQHRLSPCPTLRAVVIAPPCSLGTDLQHAGRLLRGRGSVQVDESPGTFAAQQREVAPNAVRQRPADWAGRGHVEARFRASEQQYAQNED